ncbi:unnamed protein product [Absidia cylindrospora]
MKPSIPTNDPDTVQWFIIGAYQAGASESEIVSMTNLSRFTIHNTIPSFKKTGNPNMRRRKSKYLYLYLLILLFTIAYYNFITLLTCIDRKRSPKMDTLQCDSLTDTEVDNSDCSSDYIDMDTGIQETNQRKGRLYHKRTQQFQPKTPTATDTIDYILHKGQKYAKKSISSIQKPQKQRKSQKQNDRNGTILPSSPSQSHEPTSPKLQQPLPTKNHAMDNTSSHSPSYLCTSDQPRYHHNNLSDENSLWTRKDDKLLLQHVLTRMGRWNELDQHFDGRHSGMDCVERWGVLQHYLFKQLNKNGTNGW